MTICATCEQNTDTLTCEECGASFCMDCFRRYEWKDTSRLCWECQNKADKEWADKIVNARRMASGFPYPIRRTGPRPKEQAV